MAIAQTKVKTNFLDTIIKPGVIIFLATLDSVESKEIILEIDSCSKELDLVYSSKVLIIKKSIVKDELQLIPLSNAFILSSITSIDSTKNSFEPGKILFNINKFDIFGLVNNIEILEIFKKEFSNS